MRPAAPARGHGAPAPPQSEAGGTRRPLRRNRWRPAGSRAAAKPPAGRRRLRVQILEQRQVLHLHERLLRGAQRILQLQELADRGGQVRVGQVRQAVRRLQRVRRRHRLHRLHFLQAAADRRLHGQHVRHRVHQLRRRGGHRVRQRGRRGLAIADGRLQRGDHRVERREHVGARLRRGRHRERVAHGRLARHRDRLAAEIDALAGRVRLRRGRRRRRDRVVGHRVSRRRGRAAERDRELVRVGRIGRIRDADRADRARARVARARGGHGQAAEERHRHEHVRAVVALRNRARIGDLHGARAVIARIRDAAARLVRERLRRRLEAREQIVARAVRRVREREQMVARALDLRGKRRAVAVRQPAVARVHQRLVRGVEHVVDARERRVLGLQRGLHDRLVLRVLRERRRGRRQLHRLRGRERIVGGRRQADAARYLLVELRDLRLLVVHHVDVQAVELSAGNAHRRLPRSVEEAEHGLEYRVRRLDHLRVRLIQLLVLHQVRRFLVLVHARHRLLRLRDLADERRLRGARRLQLARRVADRVHVARVGARERRRAVVHRLRVHELRQRERVAPVVGALVRADRELVAVRGRARQRHAHAVHHARRRRLRRARDRHRRTLRRIVRHGRRRARDVDRRRRRARDRHRRADRKARQRLRRRVVRERRRARRQLVARAHRALRDHARAAVRRDARGEHGRGGRDRRAVRDGEREAVERAARGQHGERIARVGRARQRQLQAADRHRRRRGARRRRADDAARRAVRQRVLRAVVRQRVVARRRLRAVDERHGQRRAAGVVLVRVDGRRADRKQAAARIAGHVDAERVLRVDLRREADRERAQLRLRGIERLAAEREQAAERAARERHVGQILRGPRLGRAGDALRYDRELARIGRRSDGRELIARIADDERLAARQEHAVVAVALHDLHARELRELRHREIALVEELVRRLALRARRRDLLVQLRDLRGVAVDLRDGVGELRIHALAQLRVLLAGGDELARECLRVAHRGLARGRVRRVVRDRLQAGEVVRDRGRDAGRRAADVIVQLRDERVVGRQRAALRLRGVQLVRQVLVVLALDGDGRHALRQIAAARVLAARFRIDGALDGIAGRRRIADVLAGRGETPERGVQAADPEVHEGIGHARS
ncbi:Planctomycete extracellular domain protein [Burkholderia pseudomallei 1710b]|uniref:Planctomycete extracellular domain protein n=1 Tax=Burkholderia pseudomallei (strain 1710b) TaxID=320372 RepID=Q3JX16_BURP1|nr:Planctomycete extracellular domain protein [Burkholderia pseudomallei 1710b]